MDRFETRSTSKPSENFKAVWTILKPAKQLSNTQANDDSFKAELTLLFEHIPHFVSEMNLFEGDVGINLIKYPMRQPFSNGINPTGTHQMHPMFRDVVRIIEMRWHSKNDTMHTYPTYMYNQ